MASDGGPAFRMWPPVAVGGPLVLGIVISSWAGDPLAPSPATTRLGWLLVAVFAIWNGWALVTMARHRTALLPGGETTTVIDGGPFARSRNPLYVGLLVFSAGVSLLAGSAWALLALPVEWALLRWGGTAGGALPRGEVRVDVHRVRRPRPALALIPSLLGSVSLHQPGG